MDFGESYYFHRLQQTLQVTNKRYYASFEYCLANIFQMSMQTTFYLKIYYRQIFSKQLSNDLLCLPQVLTFHMGSRLS